MQNPNLTRIFKAIEDGDCLPFLGAGACTAFRKNPDEEEKGLPSGDELAKLLALKCGYTNGTTYELTKVAEHFLYYVSGRRERLEAELQKMFSAKRKPRPIHTVLAQLSQIKIVITSNYDTLFEDAVTSYGRTLTKNVYNLNSTTAGHFHGKLYYSEKDAGDIILHKMHGSIDEQNTLVITESDYIRYLAYLNTIDRGMPAYFRTHAIPQSTLLFLGYSLRDWNFRVIWEGVLSDRGMGKQNSDRVDYALMKNPKDEALEYCRRHNIVVIDEDITDFAIKLAEHFQLDIPELKIEKGVQK